MKKLLTHILLLITFTTFSQNVTVSIENLKVDGTTLPNNSPIDLGTNPSVYVTFRVDLAKEANYTIGPATVYIDVFDSSGNRTEKQITGVPVSQFSTGASANYGIDIFDDEINFGNGNYLVATLKQDNQPGAEWDSEQIPIIKTPAFVLEPDSLSLACGDVSSKTFEVTNSSNLSGVSYQWNIGNGWSGNVSNSNSITLTPIDGTVLPSNVSVTPIYNGVNQPTLTCNVNRASFSTSAVITGDNYVCDTGIYTFNNLPSSISIQSVSTSDSSIAIAALDINTGEITVTKVAEGIVTLSAVLQNTCNQTVTKTKENIQIGIPSSVFNASISGSSTICSGQNYTYTLSGANHPCVTGIVWSVTDNLSIVSQSSNTITVSEALFGSDDFAGEITASIPGTTIEVKKGVLVGTPSNTGLTLQKLGSYEFYTGEWSMLKANYTPLLYESNDPLNITYDWQIPHSQIRSFTDTSRKDVNPNSAGQLTIGVRVQCDCGYGEWAYETFTVTSNGGGTGFEMN